MLFRLAQNGVREFEAPVGQIAHSGSKRKMDLAGEGFRCGPMLPPPPQLPSGSALETSDLLVQPSLFRHKVMNFLCPIRP
jgi:hypothetical protein